jgi:hypothetical protein
LSRFVSDLKHLLNGDGGFLHKCQLARRLRGFTFHLPSTTIIIVAWRFSKHLKRKTCIQQSAITGRIKIKYVMQIFKLAASSAQFLNLRDIIRMAERKVVFRFKGSGTKGTQINVPKNDNFFQCCAAQIANDSRTQILKF